MQTMKKAKIQLNTAETAGGTIKRIGVEGFDEVWGGLVSNG